METIETLNRSKMSCVLHGFYCEYPKMYRIQYNYYVFTLVKGNNAFMSKYGIILASDLMIKVI